MSSELSAWAIIYDAKSRLTMKPSYLYKPQSTKWTVKGRCMKRFLVISLMILVISPALDAQEHARQSSQSAQGGTVKTTPRRRSTRRPTGTRRRRTTRKTASTPSVPKTAVAPTSEVPWEKFSSTEGRFSVLIPIAPTDRTETVNTEHGPYTTHLFVGRDTVEKERDTIERVFIIGWVDYQPTFNFNKQAEMEANRDEFVRGMGAKLLTTRKVTIDGYQALEFTAENHEMVFKSRVYMVGRRPYQIVIGLQKGQDDAASVDRFLNSFKVNLN